MAKRPYRHNNSRAGEPANHWNDGFSASSSGPRRRIASGTPTAQQPTPARASTSAAEQWRHDVDQLVIAAINTPHREGWRQPSAQQSRFSSAVRTPSVVQAPLGLPGACLPVQHCTPLATIERNRERRRDIEGRNLERDFDLHTPVGACQVAHAPLPLAPGEFRGGGGAWRWPHICVWWSGHPSSGSTY
jgi:hypothetical protein